MAGEQRALMVVAVALVDHAGRVLMQRRPADREHGGLWEFPGGKLEPGEGPLAALVREVDEELSIEVSPGDCVPLGFAANDAPGIVAVAGAPRRDVVLLLYGCARWRGEPRAEEGAELGWIAPDVCESLEMPPLDVPLARLAFEYAQANG
ncbi:mutator mutT protein, hypothetical [Novosphingobium nitrogenifigens DSM 19370]|uniref:8-oxo-dGTP diphosphatase n=1 Tax=Novosphingobium nitrogenifigens DSM 19370 TaxID=983920 RepID=F1ZA07_9SPHN|nr:(deoxy)nucleoside triphosphate pyrophosphohydrolase [Novosphingobium nitrogenifigens]EGD58585.1 mutator mutT protein, hypothetical [Novosphingobium nitrogenifigens DSM 19370]